MHTDGAHIYAALRSCKNFRICLSQSDRSPDAPPLPHPHPQHGATSPPRFPPPHHRLMPESFAKVPITTAPPAAMLIHYDGFILAIFSICPLAFFSTANRWRQFLVYLCLYLQVAAVDLQKERSQSQKKKRGATSFRIPEIFRKFFFVPAAGWLQQSDFNTRALTHTQIQTHTHRASDWRLAVGILADEGVQTRRMLAGDQLRTSRRPSGRLAVRARVRPARFLRSRRAPCGDPHRRSSPRIQTCRHIICRSPSHYYLFIFVKKKNTDRFCDRTH